MRLSETMSGGTVVAVPGAGGLAVWRVVAPARPRRYLPAGVFGLGLLVTGCGVAAAWDAMQPDTVVHTRIVADGASDAAGRAALSELALRLAGAADRPAALQEGGEALVVTARDRDPAAARERSGSLVDAILNASPAWVPTPAGQAPAPPADRPGAGRARLAAAIDAIDARSAAVSAALTALVHDAASASRSTAERKPGRETLDKGNAALADLELQRLQLVTKYQDTYPAVVALDGQIRSLRVFLMDEAHRIEPRATAADPAEALLSNERERLLAEASQLSERRRVAVADLATADRRLAVLPPVVAAAAASATVVPPVLVAAATTSFTRTDDARLTIVPAIAAAGLVLSAALALCVRRRPKAPPHAVVLEPLPVGMLAAAGLRTLGAAVHLPLDDGGMRQGLEQPAWQRTL